MLAVFVVVGGAAAAGAAATQLAEPWPRNWFSDMPSVDMSGVWIFDAAASDPMMGEWEDMEVRYEIRQHPAFIVFDFLVPGAQANTQNYRWDGTIQSFERGPRIVQEAARWRQAGRLLEIVGRHWDTAAPDDKTEYRFTYQIRGDDLMFTQEDAAGSTVWRFRRVRYVPAEIVAAVSPSPDSVRSGWVSGSVTR